MPLIRKIESVWVPFNITRLESGNEIGNIAGDIPRFCHPEECKDFLQLNRAFLKGRLIQFREHFEEQYKQEYAKGVGREAKYGWRYGPSYDRSTLPRNRRSLRDY